MSVSMLKQLRFYTTRDTIQTISKIDECFFIEYIGLAIITI